MKSDKKYKIIVAVLSILIILSASCTVAILTINNSPDLKEKFFSLIEKEKIESLSESSMEETIKTETFPYGRLTTYKPTADNIRPIGRTIYQDDTLWFSMSGCGAEFKCKGKYAKITFEVYNSQYITYSHRPRIAIYTNNILAFDEVLDEEEQTFTVELDSFDGDVTIKIIKLSESMYSCVGIKEVSVFSNTPIVPTNNDKLKIEFVGDSITCGYGLDEERSHAAFSTRTENFSKTYAYLASNALNAECYAVSFSGYGVLSGFTSNGTLQDEYVLKDKYNKAVTGMKFEQDYLSVWDFQKYRPDIIVINLGTNDASYCSTFERRQRFIEEYEKLLVQIRRSNSQAFIVCLLGDMNNSMYPSIEQAVSSYAFNNGDNKIRCTTISFEMGIYGSVIDGHPTIDSNILAAETLEQYLNDNILDLLDK